ncbi:MAG: hypothetical protein JXQ72_17500 [Anaerolineae bacterium]|nr:hypothetical protein [Anaerolineae bacterium]
MSKHGNCNASNLIKLAGLGAYVLFLRPQMLKWGTRLGESQRRLPGDEHVPEPNFQMTHAINIDAPAEAVWPWLAQMGRERTGYYGLDIWNNQSIPSVTFIRQDIGAPVTGMEMDGGYLIMALEPNRQLLFGGFNLQKPLTPAMDITWLYLLERRSDGSTRLLVRQRSFGYGALAPLYNLGHEVISFVHLMKQLQTLKQYAESMAHLAAQ